MNFLLEFPGSGRDAFAVGPNTVVEALADREIAGHVGRCYRLNYPAEAEATETTGVELPEFCFGEGGVELYRAGAAPFGHAKLTALSASSEVDDADFDYPYRLIRDD
jgi:hypothetical protein